MCTTCAVHMCLALLRIEESDSLSGVYRAPGAKRDAEANIGHLLRSVMQRSSKAHGFFLGAVPSMSDLLARTLPRFGLGVQVDEYVICAEGCNELKDGKPTSYLIALGMLAPCLKAVHGVCTATLTCGGHSVCVWREGEVFGVFDSLPSRMVTGMTLAEFEEEVNRFIVGQCDVTVLSQVV
jgi:hypothetical protein